MSNRWESEVERLASDMPTTDELAEEIERARRKYGFEEPIAKRLSFHRWLREHGRFGDYIESPKEIEE